MDSNRKYLWILAVLLATLGLPSGSAAAQYQGGGYGRPQGADGRRGPMPVGERVKRLTKELNLTADQQTKITSILEDEQKKAQDLMNDSAGDRQAMRQKMMQLRQDTSDQVRALLDDKQKGKFDKMEQERQDRMQNRRGGGRGEPGGENPGGSPPPQN